MQSIQNGGLHKENTRAKSLPGQYAQVVVGGGGGRKISGYYFSNICFGIVGGG